MLWMLGFFAIFVVRRPDGRDARGRSAEHRRCTTRSSSSPTFITCLIGGAVFPLFGAFYYWYPKITGRMLERAAGCVGVLRCCSSAST